MNTFRTDVSVGKSGVAITPKTAIFTAGSCFADTIGQQLYRFKFQTLPNPFGVTYNPVSIHKLFLKSIGNDRPEPENFLENQGIYLNFDFHSEISALTKEELFHKISQIGSTAHTFLKTARWIMITYGTSWVYEKKGSGEIVANCHKLPQAMFTKRLLAEDEIIGSFQHLKDALKKINPSVRIILTLSPVRHIKDTLELNSVSKAVLRSACHAIISDFQDVEYFPAYEIMLDDLRDYRFYKSDMLHPNDEAEEYIWNKFAERYFDNETRKFIGEWSSVRTALGHKPFHPGSAAHQQFLRQTLKKLESFKDRINVEEEIAMLEKQLL